jgi:hypothetical protein
MMINKEYDHNPYIVKISFLISYCIVHWRQFEIWGIGIAKRIFTPGRKTYKIRTLARQR